MMWDGAFPFVTLSCTCASGEQQEFEVRVQPVSDAEGDVWFYLAKPLASRDQGDDEYFASFKRAGADLLQLEAVVNDLAVKYQRCGITRALLPHIAAQHSARIRSSRHRPAEGETRSEAATKVWKRMVSEGVAMYDSAEDRFYFPATQVAGRA